MSFVGHGGSRDWRIARRDRNERPGPRAVGQARGRVRAIYQNLEIVFLDKQTGTENGFDNRVASFLTKVLKIRNSNAPDASGSMKEGKVNYTRRRGDEFQQFAWFALRTGVLDIISH